MDLHGLVQQLPALLGVVVGVITTFALTTFGERTRWRRDQRVRWDAARLEGYIQYGNAVKRVVHVASRLAVTRGLKHSSEAVDLAEGLDELFAAAGHRTACWETVLLLGQPETISAARAWHQTVWLLEFYARGILDGQEGWARALQNYERARSEYYRCARRDLGLEGAIPGGSWPPAWYDGLDAEQQRAIASHVAYEEETEGPGPAAEPPPG